MNVLRSLTIGAAALLTAAAVAQTAPTFDPHREVAQAIASIRRVAMSRDRLDWAAIETKAQAQASEANDEADLLPVYGFILDQLDDHGHSMQLPPTEVRAAYVARHPNLPIPRELPLRALVAGTGNARPIQSADQSQRNGKIIRIISLPGLNGPDPGGSYAQTVFTALTKAPAACGFIVDLREDTDGNMFPMVAGLSPLLGDGYHMMVPTDTKPALVVVERGTPTGYETRGGVGEKLASTPGWKPSPALASAPVAILTSVRTASAGEDLAVQFRGRANTLSFGATTKGEASANIPLKQESGMVFFVTSGLFADRNGHTYLDGLTPDIKVTASASALGNDAAAAAANTWLTTQASCR